MKQSLLEAEKRYGKIIDGKWSDESKWMVVYTVPLEVSKVLINSSTGKSTNKIYCNKDLVPILNQAFKNVINRNLLQELKTFDGCFMIRSVRGATSPSTHSYGLAIDINKKENELGHTPLMSPELVKCFTDAGFTWGGKFKRMDGMHFSSAWE